jgi:hypothetical protein
MTKLGVKYAFIAEPPVLTNWPAEPAVCHGSGSSNEYNELEIGAPCLGALY